MLVEISDFHNAAPSFAGRKEGAALLKSPIFTTLLLPFALLNK